MITKKQLKTYRTFKINMPQMANSSLSENWLFKELGNIHWELIQNGINVNSSCIVNKEGQRLYATFILIKLDYNLSNPIEENQILEFDSSLSRKGGYLYFSNIISPQGLNAELSTIFSMRSLNKNTNLIKNTPYTTTNKVPVLEDINSFKLHKAIRKKLVKNLKIRNVSFSLEDSFIFESEYEINPFYDINGVGMLYFAAYPIIANFCEWKYLKNNKLILANNTLTLSKQIFYFSNCEVFDTIIYRLHYYEQTEKFLIKSSCSLIRKSDMSVMAKIFTLKKLDKMKKQKL